MVTKGEWELLNASMNAYMHGEALAAACELRLFDYLAKHPDSSLDGIARGMELAQHGVRVLLLGCASAGLVERDEQGRYRNSSVAEKLLVCGKADYFGNFIKFNHDVQQRCARHLAESIRQNRNVGLDELPGKGKHLYERLTENTELETLFHAAMGAYSRLAPKVLDAPGLTGISRLIDVGGGDGSIAMALCRKNAAMQVWLMDKPSVCEIAARTIAGEGLSDRITCVPCDIFADAWPRDVNGVLMSHLVEIFSSDRIRALYGAAYDALAPGGRLVVWTLTCRDDESGGLQAAKSSIYFLTTASGEGMAYPATDHVAWLEQAGFRPIERYSYPEFDHSAILATKP
jgi:hypothetical protein